MFNKYIFICLGSSETIRKKFYLLLIYLKKLDTLIKLIKLIKFISKIKR
jgi:hypothetical protein